MSSLVSIIMPSYNTAPYIAESIRSVMAQTYTDWELIIVDDASTDNTDEVVKDVILSGAQAESKDLSSKIHYLKNDRNRGAAYSRNRALREAKGRWIAFLDSDDIWTPDKLEKQIAFMTKNGCAFSYTRYEEMDENGRPTGTIVGGPKRITKTGMYNYCWPGCLTVMYDREVVGDIQIAEIQKNNDYAMWLKICRKADCYLLDENLASYRKRTGSITHACHPERSEAKSKDLPICHPRAGGDLSRHLSLIKWHYKLYREAEGMNPVVSLFNTGRNLFFGVWKKVKYVGRPCRIIKQGET
ncbi:MAG: glycosyltransferase family 2 protein [Fibrobacter sp.]|uniref:glycosyltransferase family 2 protein n=1 Tax=Fibrobacter sp. TaxID=35828 RepID=UPI0025BCC0D0|nr:glycosyltransferase family 2 protein [Fibrobacter sp.]MBQ3722041.1 glycosyltransferase family 2 protein [Fibrobacter sp.]MBQ7079656.1 glycosyltransferase family 2 protein [Fibrobacter sp.]